MEPLTRIELARPAWKAGVLPLNYNGLFYVLLMLRFNYTIYRT